MNEQRGSVAIGRERATISYLSIFAVLSLSLLLVLGILLANDVTIATYQGDTSTTTLFLPLVIRTSVPHGYPILKPPVNDYAVPITSTISIVYDELIDPATVSDQTFVVHGSQTGLLAGSYSVRDNTVVMTPTGIFKHGDEIVVTLSNGVSNISGASLTPFIWGFRTVILPTVVGGTGRLEPHPTTPTFGKGGGRIVSAVALGDLDGDGDLDVVVAGTDWLGDSESVWLNDGFGNLSPHPARPTFGSGETRDIALGDLDKDGDLDAVVANSDGESQSVWLNGGAGTASYGQGLFAIHPTTPYFGSGTSHGVALGDLDGDGDLDAVVANYGEAQTVWLNGGKGDFRPHSTTPTFGAGYSEDIALGDLDGDGDLDAMVANQFEVRANTVWLNDGQGNFSPHPTTPAIGDGESEDIVLGDLDGDGDLDAIVANTFPYPVETVWLNDGQGNLSPHPTTPAFGLESSTGIVLGDLDGDGDLDAVIANSSGNTNTVWVNDGTGDYAPHPITFDTESYSAAVALGDLDGDGDLDVVVGNIEEPNTVWLNQNPDQADLALHKVVSDPFPKEGDTITYTVTVDNSGPFTATGVTVIDSLPIGVTLIDAVASRGVYNRGVGTVNVGSGIWDLGTLFIGESETLSITVVVNAGTDGATITNLAQVRTSNSFDPDSAPGNGLISEDDHDVASSIVNPLLVTDTDPTGSDAVISLGEGVAVTFDRAVSATTVNSATFIVHGAQTGRYTGAYTFPAENQVQFDATGFFKPGEGVVASLGNGISAVSGAPLAPFTWQFRAAVTSSTGDFDPHPTTPNFGADYSQAVSLGDLDADGDLDALVVNSEVITAAHVNTVWLNDGEGNLEAHPTTPSFGEGASFDAALGDVDGDGDLDAIVAKNGGRPQTVWLNDGAGNFSAHPTTPSFGGGYSRAVALGDLDGDGDLDAVVGHEDLGTTVWLNDQTGSFSPHPYTPTFGEGNSWDIALGDLDGDGDLDAVVAKRWGQPQTVWLNDGTGSLHPHPTRPVFGGNYSLAVSLGDLDGDGDLDAVIGNAGDDHANTVWLNDGLGNLSPHPTTPNFDTNDSGIDIGLADLDGDDDLDVFEIDGDGEVVWLNDGTGSFALLHALINYGGTAVALGDLNGDGDLDAVVAVTSGLPQRVWLNRD